MATPALRALRQSFVGADLIGVLRPYVAGVLDGCPWIDRQVFLDPNGPWAHRWISVAAQLRQEQVDTAVLLTNSFHTALIARLAGCKRRIGYARYGRSFLLTDKLPPLRDQAGRLRPSPVVDSYNRLAEAAGCPAPSRQLELTTLPADEAAADLVWHRAGLSEYPEVVCLNPGAAFGSAKHWPARHFAALAQGLADRRGCGVLVLCGPAERRLAQQIASEARRAAVHSLADAALSLGLTKACVRRADLLITTDSGPRHFAAAFDRPVITLFGPTHVAWTETYHPRAVHLQKVVPCGPCQRRICPLDHRCMETLSPAEVFASAMELLDRSKLVPVPRPPAPGEGGA